MAVELGTLISQALGELRYQPTPKRVRVLRNGNVLADTLGARLVWEPGRAVPSYGVPRADVSAELEELPPRSEPVPSRPLPIPGGLTIYDPGTPFAFHTTPGREFTVVTGTGRAEAAAFVPDDAALADVVILDFDAFDWLEEDEPLMAHPRDPFSRIDVRSSSRKVRFEHSGVVVAESDRTLMLFEGPILPPRYYLPVEDVRVELRPTSLHTRCAYKGEASYWSAIVGEETLENLVWGYPEPLRDMTLIAGRVSLFNERLEVFVDGVQQAKPVSPFS